MLEYIFENRKYDMALRDVKATLFDIVSTEEAKIASLMSKIYKSTNEEYQAKLVEVCNAQDECLKRVLKVFSELEKTLKKLDSYSRELKHIDEDNLNDIIDNYKAVVKDQARTIEQVQAYLGNQAANGEKTNGGDTNQPQFYEEPQLIGTQPALENEAQNISEVTPTNAPAMTATDSTVAYDSQIGNQPAEMTTNTALASSGDEIIPFDDNLSKVTEGDFGGQPGDATATETNEATAEVALTPATDSTTASLDNSGDVIIPFDDNLSKVTEGDFGGQPSEASTTDTNEASAEVAATPAVDSTTSSLDNSGDVIIPFDDNLSKVTEGDFGGQPSEASATETTEATSEVAATPATDGTAPVLDASTNSESTPLLIPTVNNAETPDETVVFNDDNSQATVISGADDEKIEKNVAASILPEIIPIAPVENKEQETSNAPVLTIPQIDTNSEPILKSEDSNKPVFKKNDSNQPKVIITTAQQTSNLRNSLQQQESLIKGAGALSNDQSLENQLIANGLLPADKQSQIESMMKQANDLYAAGNVEESQKLLDQVSAMNKELQAESVGITK